MDRTRIPSSHPIEVFMYSRPCQLESAPSTKSDIVFEAHR